MLQEYIDRSYRQDRRPSVEANTIRDNAAIVGVGQTEYGVRFTSALARDNIFATQFHPEKSARDGLVLYRNFLHWSP